jgi:hypothetical protein
MTRAQRIASALIVGITGSLVTMALHPTGGDVAREAAAGGSNAVARGAHVLAIAMQPLLAAGFLGLTLLLARRREVAVTAFVSYAIATVAVVIAAACSGLVSPRLIEAAMAADGVERAGLLAQARFAFVLNQAMAKIYVGLAAGAIVLWSAAMRGDAAFPQPLAWFGLGVGGIGVVAIVSGRLPLHVQGFGLVVLVLAAWIVGVAAALWRLPEVAPPAVR